ncbi:MAG: magnesium transporter [Ectothiorhodospiraceae bacterium AqS1]|nr:magnesium transporter [Ectothiorhodospiraceae bacterium AqS1]
MNQSMKEDSRVELLARVHESLAADPAADLRHLLEGVHPGEIAFVLESLPPGERDAVWPAIDPQIYAEVFAELQDVVRASRLADLPPDRVAWIARHIDPDDAADLLQDLPEDFTDEVLAALPGRERRHLEAVLHYGENTAGGLMNLDTLVTRPDRRLDEVLHRLRARGNIPEKTNRLFVIDGQGLYLGSLRLADLLINDPECMVEDLMLSDLPVLPASMEDSEVARLFEQRNLFTAPVIDAKGTLIGRITVDDIIDVIREEGEHSLMSMAGLNEEEELFSPVLDAARARMLWLATNLATAFVAAWVFGLFEATIREIVALAVLVPVVASMGGIAGIQTLTLVIRAQSLDQVGRANFGALMLHELRVGLINSALWSVVVGVVAWLWFDRPILGAVAAAALAINFMSGVMSGAIIPVLLKRMGIDAALAGGVILTTVTDVVGIFALLGMGSYFLLG